MHAFINDLERPVGTYLYGRRMYETMVAWETDPAFAAHSELTRDFRPDLDGSREDRLLGDAGGKQAFPDRMRQELELLAERRFEGGMVHLRYRISA